MTSSTEREVAHFIHKVGLIRFAHRALWFAVAWLFFWGVVVLVLRYGFRLPVASMWLGALGLLPCVAAAWFLEWPRRPSEEAARAYLDHRNNCGGMLMGGPELAAWRHRLPKVKSPALHWRKGSPLMALAVAAAFVLATLLIPQSLITPILAADKLEIDDQVDELLEHIDELEALDGLSDSEAKEMKEKLGQLQEDADGTDPVSTWAALDQLEDMLAEESAQAATNLTAELSKTAEAAEQAENLAEAMENLDQRNIDPASLSKAMRELAEMLQDKQVEDLLAQMGSGEDMKETLEKLANGLDPEDLKDLAESLKGGNPEAIQKQMEKLAQGMDPDALRELAEKLGGGKAQLQQQLKEMAERGLIDPQTLEESLQQGQLGQKEGQGEGKGSLSEFLDQELAEGGEGKTPMQGGVPGQPGEWGTNRGPGHAPLGFLNNTSEDGVTFKPVVLSPASIQALKDSKLTGVTKAAPGLSKAGPGSSGALSGANADAGSVNTHKIFPQHKGAVQNYFDR